MLIPTKDLSKLSVPDLELYLALLEEKEKRERENQIDGYYTDSGKFARSNYPMHTAFFEAGLSWMERGIVAANRVGKTTAALYEIYLHTRGDYPWWWVGRRFDGPITVWVAGDTAESTRQSLQNTLLGSIENLGTGIIPKHILDQGRLTRKPGTPDAILDVYIPHISGKGKSHITFKSYEKGREAFQGEACHVILLDEQPDKPGVYTECLLRLATTNGLMMCVFTPLKGLNEMGILFAPKGILPPDHISGSKWVIGATWNDDIPHLDAATKAKIIAGCDPKERDIRMLGAFNLGSGAIYSSGIAEVDITVKPFPIPTHWPRVYALDVGWNTTAVLFAAQSVNDGTWFGYKELVFHKQPPEVVAAAIRREGEMYGVVDTAATGASQKDGERLIDIYRALGLRLEFPDKSVEAGIAKVYQMLSYGQFKVFSNLTNFLTEYRLYRRDDKGRVVKLFDHIMDCLRYLIMSGLDIMGFNQTLFKISFDRYSPFYRTGKHVTF